MIGRQQMTVDRHRCPLCRGSGAVAIGSRKFVTERGQQRLRIIGRVTTRADEPGEQAGEARLRAALVAHLADETAAARRRRERRAARRREVVLHVPPADAPAVARRAVDRAGRPPRSGAGRPRAAVPMRALVSLWAHGFSALAIEAIAHAAGLATSSSALGRLFAQAGAAFEGADARRAAELVAESPLPDAHQPRAFAARMQAWRAQHHLTKTRASRLAGVSPAAWRHLERGEPDARPAAVEAVARLIEQGRIR